MGFFDRLRSRRRKSADTSEQMTLDQLLNWLGVHGVANSELSEATYFACIKVLSESIGKLPLRLMQATPDRGVTPARGHRYYRTLNERPNRFMSASVFWTYMEYCRNHFGNAYALIDESDREHPQLWPLDPRSMQVWYDDARQLSDLPDVYYVYSTAAGTITYGSEEILHFKSHQTLDGLVGVSVREQLASTIQGNIKAQKMVNKMYDSGMTAKAVLQYTGNLKDASVEQLTKGIESYAKGELKSKGIENIIPMPIGMTLTPLSLKLADSQFLEVKQYSALQIAAAFGVKPNQVGDYSKSSYANAEAQQLSFLVDTLLFNIKQYEEELQWKLLLDGEAAAGFVTKFNTSVLLRADQQTQINTLSAAVSNFLMTPNEARERLDLPHKEGGDNLLGNGAAIPVQFTGAQYTQAAVPAATTTREEDKAWIKTAITEALSEILPG
jgi:HK97 family phage portal protein|nr:MAG TPA: portal protein [Bacteriophage sp.]